MTKSEFQILETKYFEGLSNEKEEAAYLAALSRFAEPGSASTSLQHALEDLREKSLTPKAEERMLQELGKYKPRKRLAPFIWISGVAASLLIAALLPYQLNTQESQQGTALVLNNTSSQAEMILAKAYLEESLMKVSSGLSESYDKIYVSSNNRSE